MKGLFISFEGTDASGKSTQIRLLEQWLKNRGFEPLITREPGGTRIGEKIRELLLDKENAEMKPSAEAFLYAASRAQHVEELIRPALEEGRVVITDRFVDSSIAYQGYARELGDMVSAINRYAVAGVMPDLTVLLVTDPAAMRQRRGVEQEDRIEAEGEGFQGKVRRGFLEAAAKEPDRFLVIDGHRSIEDISQEITGAVSALIGQRDE